MWRNFFGIITVLVVDDDESEIMLYKHYLEVDKCHFVYRRGLDGIFKDLKKYQPAHVFVDQHLKGATPGSEFFKFCELNCIDCKIVTGDEGDIVGVSPDKIIRKSQDLNHIQKIKQVINQRRFVF